MRLRNVMALAAWLWASGSTATPSEREREHAYWQMVEAYAGEAKSKALGAARSWSHADLEEVMDSLSKLSKTARKCSDCEARSRFEALPLRAAVLLHSERDRANRLLDLGGNDHRPECRPGPDGVLSEQLLEHARFQSGGDDFAARFAVAMVLHHRSLFCQEEADRWVRLGLKAGPKNPQALLAQGMVDETVGTLADSNRPPSTTSPPAKTMFPDTRAARLRMARRYGYRSLELKRASEAFESALKIDPQLTEARLRVGRVQWRMGELQQAEASLRRALAESDGSTVFLAHLFLGRVLEDSGSIEEAIRQYERAAFLEPRAQVAAMALAHTLILRGEGDRAREVLGPVLGMAGRQHEVNHYWNYLVGVPALAESRFEELRVEAGR